MNSKIITWKNTILLGAALPYLAGEKREEMGDRKKGKRKDDVMPSMQLMCWPTMNLNKSGQNWNKADKRKYIYN